MPYTNVYRRSNDLLKINSAQSDHSDSDDGAGLGHGVLADVEESEFLKRARGGRRGRSSDGMARPLADIIAEVVMSASGGR